MPGCDSGSVGDSGVEAVGGMGVVLCACRLSAHAGRPAVRHKGRGFAGRRVNRLRRFNITGVIQNAQAARGLPRALRITMLCPAPACGLVRRGRVQFTPARPAVCCARRTPCGLPFPCSQPAPIRPKGLPSKPKQTLAARQGLQDKTFLQPLQVACLYRGRQGCAAPSPLTG